MESGAGPCTNRSLQVLAFRNRPPCDFGRDPATGRMGVTRTGDAIRSYRPTLPRVISHDHAESSSTSRSTGPLVQSGSRFQPPEKTVQSPNQSALEPSGCSHTPRSYMAADRDGATFDPGGNFSRLSRDRTSRPLLRPYPADLATTGSDPTSCSSQGAEEGPPLGGLFDQPSLRMTSSTPNPPQRRWCPLTCGPRQSGALDALFDDPGPDQVAPGYVSTARGPSPVAEGRHQPRKVHGRNSPVRPEPLTISSVIKRIP